MRFLKKNEGFINVRSASVKSAKIAPIFLPVATFAQKAVPITSFSELATRMTRTKKRFEVTGFRFQNAPVRP